MALWHSPQDELMPLRVWNTRSTAARCNQSQCSQAFSGPHYGNQQSLLHRLWRRSAASRQSLETDLSAHCSSWRGTQGTLRRKLCTILHMMIDIVGIFNAGPVRVCLVQQRRHITLSWQGGPCPLLAAPSSPACTSSDDSHC